LCIRALANWRERGRAAFSVDQRRQHLPAGHAEDVGPPRSALLVGCCASCPPPRSFGAERADHVGPEKIEDLRRVDLGNLASVGSTPSDRSSGR
jgi:hypothetical protein